MWRSSDSWRVDNIHSRIRYDDDSVICNPGSIGDAASAASRADRGSRHRDHIHPAQRPL
jgi:hypothetical protein